MFVRDDIWLWESDLRAEPLTQPYRPLHPQAALRYQHTAQDRDAHIATALSQLHTAHLQQSPSGRDAKAT